MTDLRCAVTILPADGGAADRLLSSLARATEHGLGEFSEIIVLPQGYAADARHVLADAAESARGEGFGWLLAVSAAETLVPDVFVKAAPALRIHDAIWGAAALAGGEGQPKKPEPITRLAAQDLATFFHAALAWWMGPAHFVRPSAALDALQAAATPAWYADYMLALWQNASAYKTAQALTCFHDALPPLAQADRDRLIEALAEKPVFMPAMFGPLTLRLPYTGLNPVIEREQMRGQFFEHEELRYLAGRLPRGQRIVDAGANTGNHTVFFASAMQAETVIPIEPHPRAAAAIRDTVRENGLGNVDLSCLGVALGAQAGRVRPILSDGGGLGATRFVPDPQGPVAVAPLDTLVAGPVDFLKIDVEGMEMQVLAGARMLVKRCRPVIYIEILDENIAEFMAWADSGAYRIEKLFPDKTHCNYLLVPDEP